MAKILGPLHSDFAAGSLGNTVYKRNQYGFYCYTKPTYVDDPTDTQTAWRENFAEVCAVWDDPAAITADRRAMWVDFAQRFASSVRYGREIYCSPRQWFLKLNCHRHKMGKGYILYPPHDPSPSYFPLISFVQHSDGIYLNATNWPDSEQMIHVSWVPNQSTLRNFCPKSAEVLSYVSSASANPFLVVPNDLLTTDIRRSFFVLRCIDYKGRLSPRQVIFLDCKKLVLPENPITFSDHNLIYSGDPDTNHSNDTVVWILNQTSVDLLWLDISIFDPTIIITKASIFIYCWYSYGVPLQLTFHCILDEWYSQYSTWKLRDTGINWHLPGMQIDTDFLALPTVTASTSAGVGWKEIDITELIQAWISQSLPVSGIRVSGDYPPFAAYTPSNGSQKPYLVIT